MSSPEVIINGYFGYGNLGDEIILRSEIKNLKAASSNLKITVLVKSPSSYKAPEGVSVIGRYNTIKIVKKLKRGVFYVTGGGGIFQDRTSIRSLFYYTFLIRLARFFGSSPVIFAGGIGPVDSGIGKRLLKRAAMCCSYVSLRDAESKELLSDICKRDKDFKVTSDQAFTIKPCSIKAAAEILIKNKISQKFIAVSVRDTSPAINEKAFAEEIMRIADAENASAVFFPMQLPNDTEICKRLAELTSGKVLSGLSGSDLAGVLSLAEFAVGMRLHFLILCIVAGCQTVAVPYDKKVSAVMSGSGCAEWIADTDGIYKKYRFVKQHPQSLKETASRLRETAYDDAMWLAELIDESEKNDFKVKD